jgi:hypothetical protein
MSQWYSIVNAPNCVWLIITDPGSILGTTFFSWDFNKIKAPWKIPTKPEGSRQSRPIQIKIKISQSVKINFWNLSRLSLVWRQNYFLSRLRFLKLRLRRWWMLPFKSLIAPDKLLKKMKMAANFLDDVNNN